MSFDRRSAALQCNAANVLRSSCEMNFECVCRLCCRCVCGCVRKRARMGSMRRSRVLAASWVAQAIYYIYIYAVAYRSA